MIRTLQDQAVAAGIDVYMECTITRLITGRRPGDRGVRLLADDGRPGRLPGEGRRPRDRRHRPGVRDHVEFVGVQRRRAGPGLRRRCRAHRHGVRPVPSDRHGLAARRARPAGHRGRPRRGRDPAQPRRRAIHVEVPARGPASGVRGHRRGGGPLGDRAVPGPGDRRAAAARALDPRQRRAGHLHGGPRGSGVAARRRLPRHQLPAGRARPPQAALDVRPVHGARRRRHHEGSRWRSARPPTT